MKHNSLITRNNNLFNSFFNDDDFAPFSSITNKLWNMNFPEFVQEFDIDFDKTAYPKVNVKETDSNYTIIAEIPNIDKENVNVEYDSKTNVLKIQGDKKLKNEDEKEEKGVKWIRKEIKQSSFTRCFYIDVNKIENEKISAEYKDNYLNIIIPKKVIQIEKDSTKKIEIK